MNKRTDKFHCNICKLKLSDARQFAEHKASLFHQCTLERMTTEMFKKLTAQKMPSTLEVRRKIINQQRRANAKACQRKLLRKWGKLSCIYDQYAQKPFLHPQYAKEWIIFYNGATHATNDSSSPKLLERWSKYWQCCMQACYQQDQRKIIESIAKIYETNKATANDYLSIDDDSSDYATDSDYESLNLTSSCERSPHSILQNQEKNTWTIKPEYASLDQDTLELKVSETVLEFLKKHQMDPEQLNDMQLGTYIQLVFDMRYCERH